MSLKPPKKSDLGKSWMKNRRDKARMIQPEYHLIASEGTETEPQYFGAIQRIINSKYRDRIQLKVEGIGDNTVNLLMKARQYVQDNGMVFKHVWIVYDTDDFPAENIDMVAQLCEEYNVQGETIYHAVWSNQCVELWYLLHFVYMDTDIDRSRYWPKLSDWLKNIDAGGYEKTVRICMKCCGLTWTLQLPMQSDWTNKMKDGNPLSQHPERKFTNWLRC